MMSGSYLSGAPHAERMNAIRQESAPSGLRAPEVRQQGVDVLGLGGRQASQHITQIGIGVAAIGLGTLDQAVERGRGVVQVNFILPSSTPVGTQPVVVTIGGVASPPVNLVVTQ